MVLLCGLAAGPAAALNLDKPGGGTTTLPDARTWPAVQNTLAVTMTTGQGMTFLCKATAGTLTAFTTPTTTTVTVNGTTTRALVVRC